MFCSFIVVDVIDVLPGCCFLFHLAVAFIFSCMLCLCWYQHVPTVAVPYIDYTYDIIYDTRRCKKKNVDKIRTERCYRKESLSPTRQILYTDINKRALQIQSHPYFIQQDYYTIESFIIFICPCQIRPRRNSIKQKASPVSFDIRILSSVVCVCVYLIYFLLFFGCCRIVCAVIETPTFCVYVFI